MSLTSLYPLQLGATASHRYASFSEYKTLSYLAAVCPPWPAAPLHLGTRRTDRFLLHVTTHSRWMSICSSIRSEAIYQNMVLPVDGFCRMKSGWKLFSTVHFYGASCNWSADRGHKLEFHMVWEYDKVWAPFFRLLAICKNGIRHTVYTV